MSVRTPAQPDSSVPLPSQPGYGQHSLPRTFQSNSGVTATDFGTPGQPSDFSPLSQSTSQNYSKFNEEWDASQRGSSLADPNLNSDMQRSNSVISQGGMSQGHTLIPSRGGTLKKKASVKRASSFKRSGSRRSSRAGSVRSLALNPQGEEDEMRSAFYSPVPTTGNPTEILANRFNAWRKVLKDLITYFREIQSQYDSRSKSLLKISNVINNTTTPPCFLTSGGLDDALKILRNYHKQAIMEANKSKDIENDVILALTGLRSDLQQKIKEIKSLSGDFKNSVEKEMDATRKAVAHLQEALGQSDHDSASMTGKQDPYLLRLAVDHQVEKQIDEENYLHQAYLNLEASGRELEAIVVGEIQKSYNAYAGILKREADEAYETIETLRTGPIAMPKDHEWVSFVEHDEHFVDPRIPVRRADNIYYPGRDNELAAEVRAGLLERKSKYLKSYTAGWFVLSPTHLHEFKSADKSQAPIMSLYLPDQKLGSHSTEGSSSNKFMLKGRQTGSMHRGHSWVFRAESYDTMMAWYEDIKALTEKSPQERSAFVRLHARSFSGTSQTAPSVGSSEGMDEEDDEPYSANASSVAAVPRQDTIPRRPQPGGRFPSDLQVNAQRGLQAPLSPSSGSSGFAEPHDRDVVAAVGAGEHFGQTQPSTNHAEQSTDAATREMQPTHASELNQYAQEDGVNPYTYQPIGRSDTTEALVGTAGVGAIAGVAGTEAYHMHQQNDAEESAQIATPDDQQKHEMEMLAQREAATIAAPDENVEAFPEFTGTTSEGTPYASGGRSMGDVTTDGAPGMDGSASPTVIKDSDHIKDALRPLTESRPSLAAGQDHQSVMSISQLHVPGEFPPSAPADNSAKLPV